MQYNNRSIVLAELIGLRARVIDCLDRKQRGLEGLVIDETKNSIVLQCDEGTKRVIKAISTFRFYSGRRSFVVRGEEINFRSYERLEKGMKFYKKRASE